MKATVLALALLCAGAAYAQSASTATTPAAREAEHFNNLATLLDLTDAQKPQVQSILQAEHAKIKAAFEQLKSSGSKPDWTQVKALHQQIQQETLQQLTPILSATQLKKFQIIQQSMHGPGRFGHGGPSPESAPPQN